jgi:hypothetical protein
MAPSVGEGAAAALVGAALVGVAVIFLRRWRRSDRPERQRRARRRRPGSLARRLAPFADLGLVFIGVTLIVIGFWAGLAVLRVHGAPVGQTQTIGFRPPEPAVPGRGIAIGMSIQTQGCENPVQVKILAGPTAEYWRDYVEGLPADVPFALAIPDERVRAVRVGLGTSPDDVPAPLYARTRHDPRIVTVDPVVERWGVMVVGGRMHNWHRTFGAVSVTFEADWLERRSIGACYLRAPGIVGADTVFPVQQALNQVSSDRRRVESMAARVGVTTLARNPHTGLWYPYLPGYGANEGSTTVVVDGGGVLADASLPGPDAEFDGHPQWTCSWDPQEGGPLGRAGPIPGLAEGEGKNRVGAYSRSALRASHESSCAVVAVIAENSAGTQRDLILLLMGTVISLGAAILVEVLLDWRKDGLPWARRAR